MKYNIEKTFICPNCGKEVIKPAMLIPASVVSTSRFKDDVEPDETLRDFIKSYGGVVPSENQLKQIVLEDSEPIPNFLKEYIKGNKLIKSVGSSSILEKACPHCHNNITLLYDSNIEKIANVILVGSPGSSKTSILKAIFKMLTERSPRIKSNDFEIASTSSFEYDYYENLPFPVPPTEFIENSGYEYRQPLFYCKVNKSLLIFHDYPGERVKIGNLYIPENAIPVYLFDPEKNINETMKNLNKAISDVHQGGRRFEREHLLYTKCDMLPERFVESIMIKSYEQSKSKEYSSLYAARCFSLKEKTLSNDIKNLPMYSKVASHCKATTVSCLAAYGVEVQKIETKDRSGKRNTEFKLKGSWNPQFLYDFLLNLTL